jgi:hypothetical protein
VRIPATRRYRFVIAPATVVLLAVLARGQDPRPRADAGTWNRRPAGAGDYEAIVEVSGRDQLGQFRVAPNPRDLKSLCDARTETRALALATLQEQVATPAGSAAERAWAHHDLAQLLSYENQVAPAIAEAEKAWKIVETGGHPGFASARGQLQSVLGVLNLRLGELKNCLHDHNADRCLFPIRGRGLHDDEAGAAAAERWFEARLREAPEDLETRWLLNVAAMTRGRHPEGVSERWLVPASAWASPDDPGRFVDVSQTVGLGRRGRAGGAVADDMDGDGRLDLVLSSVDPCEPLRFYRGRGDGSFEDVAAQKGLSGQMGGINTTQADYDNDGRLDLFVMRGGWEMPMRNSLLRQNPDGTFSDVTESAGLLKSVHRTHSAAFGDYDGDGLLDLFVGHEETPSALFRNRGDGTFEDVSKRAGVDRTAFTKGATWGDYDNDGHLDLYVSNYGEPNWLYHNEGDGTFRERAKDAGVDGPLMSFPTWFFDYDNDGWQDLFVAAFVPSVAETARGYLGLPRRAETMRLYRNTGGRFQDVTQEAGLDRVTMAMGANFGDLDDDGWLDFYLGTGAPSYAALVPNRLFRNRGARGFVEVTTATGTGHLQKGHGVAFADFDHDGDTDLFCNVGGFVAGDEYPKSLFTSPGHGHAWIEVRLVGTKANRSGLHARLSLRVRDADGAERRLERTLSSGGSFGANPLAARIGLGRAQEVAELIIQWPGSGTRQVLQGLPLRRRVTVREGDARVTAD